MQTIESACDVTSLYKKREQCRYSLFF